ncbi:MAG: preprotein translocase subunit SecG [Candidatus Falkowbacteria bacterium]|nr:preprotein translocase subunit SecG [Candidatus Falkowbacteria bacterium]
MTIDPRLTQIAQIVVSVLLIVVILLQNRGTSLSGIFGGSSNVFQTKRGVEKVLFITTIVLAVLFFGLSVVRLFAS